MKLRKLPLAFLAIGALALSGCAYSSEEIQEGLTYVSFPDEWVKIGEASGDNVVDRVYLAPSGNTDAAIAKSLGNFEVIKERPIDNTGEGEFVIKQKNKAWTLPRMRVSLAVGSVQSVDEFIDAEAKTTPVDLPTTAPEICELTPAGQDLCDEEGIDKVQVVPVSATAEK